MASNPHPTQTINAPDWVQSKLNILNTKASAKGLPPFLRLPQPDFVLKLYRLALPTMFWNLVAFNVLCVLPLIKHGRMRESLFRARGSYNPAIDHLPFTTVFFLLNWQVQKRIWNPINKPWFKNILGKYPNIDANNINRNINFASLTLISLTGSFLAANIYQLIHQDFNMTNYLRHARIPFLGTDGKSDGDEI